MTPLDRLRLEKAAADCGFEMTAVPHPDGLELRSARFPEAVLVRVSGEKSFEVGASDPAILDLKAGSGPLRVEGYRHWCGGVVSRAKLAGLVQKFADRYPIAATARQCGYARSRGRAAVKFLAFSSGERVQWWLVSTEGAGGLADPAAADARVARDAHAADGHVEFRDYVLLYATKKEPRSIADGKTGRLKTVLKDTSTWTWKLRAPVMSELRAGVRDGCERLAYGAEQTAERAGWGLRGLLAAQRRRPLFSGVRTQVIELHREANDAWNTRRAAWLAKHPNFLRKYGERAGRLPPLNEVVQAMPKMVRIPVFERGWTLASLCAEPDLKAIDNTR